MLQYFEIDKLLEALNNLCKSVDVKQSGIQEQVAPQQNAKTHVSLFKPIVGDYFLVPRTSGQWTNVPTNWVGLHRICQILSDFTFEFVHILTRKTIDVHCSHIKQYEDSLIGILAAMRNIAENNDRIWFYVNKSKYFSPTNGLCKVMAPRKGLKALVDTQETFKKMYKNALSVICLFLLSKQNTRKSKMFLASSVRIFVGKGGLGRFCAQWQHATPSEFRKWEWDFQNFPGYK